jgi:hypothetical protein
MHLDAIYPNKYIKSSDLQNREISVIIEQAKVEEVGDDRKLVLYFRGKQKGLVTNKTNANRIAHYFGMNTDAWLGREIVLFTDLVNFQGKTTEAIRVKVNELAAPNKPAPTTITRARPEVRREEPPRSENPGDGMDDEIPF